MELLHDSEMYSKHADSKGGTEQTMCENCL